MLPELENEVTHAIWLGDSTKDVESMLAAGVNKEPSKSTAARELILDILDEEGESESDALDARVAEQTGLAAKTIQNIRTDLSTAGLIKSRPERDELGLAQKWFVRRTNAPREDDA